MATSIKVDLGGPLFEGKDRPIMEAANRDAKRDLAEWGKSEVKQAALKKPKHPKGRYSEATTIHDFRKGLTIMAKHPQVLYGPWLEGTSSRNESTRFKGYRIYKQVKGRMRKKMLALVQGRYDRAVEELNGGGG